MNYSTAVFLINDTTRAISCTYEAGDNAPRTIFKTFDQDIKVGDFVVVPTETRHKMTVVKVVEVDLDIDFDSPTQLAWVISTLDKAAYERTLAQEQKAIQMVVSAERKKKKDELRAAIFADHSERLKTLEIAQDTAGVVEAAPVRPGANVHGIGPDTAAGPNPYYQQPPDPPSDDIIF